MTKAQKFFLIFPYLVLLIVVSLIADYFWKVSGYEVLFHLEEMKPIEDIDELNKSKPFISIHQINVINQDTDEINFTILSENELKTFRLLDFNFLYDDNEVKIKRNILYKLKSDNPNFFKIMDRENLIYQYEIFGGFEDYKKCKVNLKKIFSKKKWNIGDKVPVKITVHYLLDDTEYYQELNYICNCIEGDSYPPNWFMFLFPGAY